MNEYEESPPSSTGGAGIAKRGHRTACNSCKRMKVKCEWDQESICNRCTKHQTECIFTIPERKKREKKETYLTSLEDRLNRMEAVMAQSGLSMRAQQIIAKPSSDDAGLQDIPDKMSLLKIFEDGTTLFIGSSSGFSIFGAQGLKWVTEVTGSDEFAKLIMNIPSPKAFLGLASPTLWYPLPEDKLRSLPDKENALIYINEFFEGFGSIFPIFSRPIFMEKFERQYPITPSQDVAWYACLNVVFAIGSVMQNKHLNEGSPRSTASSPRSQNPGDEIWWKWFRNASSMYLELQFREASLGAVQAMIGMAFILQTIPNPYPCTVLCGDALRLAQAIGLHREFRNLGIGLSSAQVEERRNVFWSAVIVERLIIIRSGRPSVMQEDDIGIALPKPDESIHRIPSRLQPFRYIAILSLLQGRIYNKLYSAKATTLSTLEKLQWVGTLDDELQEWKDSLPIEIRPGNELKVDKDFVIPVLMMHYGYFNALTIIHRCSIHYGSYIHNGEASLKLEAMNDMKLNPRVFASGAITVGAARSVIDLLTQHEDIIDITELNTLRMLDYYPLSACLILFANVLQNPKDPQALSDIDLMKSAVSFLSRFMEPDDKTVTGFIMQTFRAVNDVAARFLARSRAQSMQNPKRVWEALKTPNYELNSSPLDNVDKEMTSAPPALLSSSEPNDPAYVPSSATTFGINIGTPFESSYSVPTPPRQAASAPPFSVHQAIPNQPSTTQQFLNDPLAPPIGQYSSDMYGSGIYGNDMSGMGGLDAAAGVDFFPNDLLMPNDGSWFFPLGAMGGIPSAGGNEPWVNTLNSRSGWSVGAGQNFDWGFGETTNGTATGVKEEGGRNQGQDIG